MRRCAESGTGTDNADMGVVGIVAAGVVLPESSQEVIEQLPDSSVTLSLRLSCLGLLLASTPAVRERLRIRKRTPVNHLDDAATQVRSVADRQHGRRALHRLGAALAPVAELNLYPRLTSDGHSWGKRLGWRPADSGEVRGTGLDNKVDAL